MVTLAHIQHSILETKFNFWSEVHGSRSVLLFNIVGIEDVIFLIYIVSIFLCIHSLFSNGLSACFFSR